MLDFNSSLLVSFIIFVTGFLCDDTLLGAAIKQGNTERSNTTEWPPLNQRTFKPSSNVETLRLKVNEWPSLNETRRSNPNNFHNRQSNNNSFVQSQIQRWNSQNTQTQRPYTGIQFGDQNQRTNYSTQRQNVPSYTGIQFGDQNQNGQNENLSKGSNVQVTDNELREFSENLLLKDDNNAAKYVRINFQGRTTSRSKNDEAPLPLLSVSNEAYEIPTISKLRPLYDNYIVQSNVNEDHTNEEKQEENSLLRSILDTNVMRTTRNFLIEKGGISGNERDFEKLLHEMWFHLYSRGKGKVGSSGFEHVFLGEIKKGDVSGLHNWLYFEREEAGNRANYLGYLKKISLGDKGAILKFNFDFHGINKPVGSMFIGTSPEFEMALYSVCFILRADKVCPLKLNNKRFVIRTYTYKYDGKDLIGSAFAEI